MQLSNTVSSIPRSCCTPLQSDLPTGQGALESRDLYRPAAGLGTIWLSPNGDRLDGWGTPAGRGEAGLIERKDKRRGGAQVVHAGREPLGGGALGEDAARGGVRGGSGAAGGSAVRAGPQAGGAEGGPAEGFAGRAGRWRGSRRGQRSLRGSQREVEPAEEAGQGGRGDHGGRRDRGPRWRAHHPCSTRSFPADLSAVTGLAGSGPLRAGSSGHFGRSGAPSRRGEKRVSAWRTERKAAGPRTALTNGAGLPVSGQNHAAQSEEASLGPRAGLRV